MNFWKSYDLKLFRIRYSVVWPILALLISFDYFSFFLWWEENAKLTWRIQYGGFRKLSGTFFVMIAFKSATDSVSKNEFIKYIYKYKLFHSKNKTNTGETLQNGHLGNRRNHCGEVKMWLVRQKGGRCNRSGRCGKVVYWEGYLCRVMWCEKWRLLGKDQESGERKFFLFTLIEDLLTSSIK